MAPPVSLTDLPAMQPCEPMPGNKSDMLEIQTDCPLQCWKEADLTLGTQQFVYY